MIRWYKGFQCGGTTPQALISLITRQVERYDLGAVVPVVRYEKDGGRGGFYCFLGIESENIGEIPDQVRSVLLGLPGLRNAVEGGFPLDAISSMAKGELAVRDYARRVRYYPPPRLPDFDPFGPGGPSTVEHDAQADAVIAHTQAYDRLLFWLSAVGSGTKRTLQHACHTLGLDPDGKQAGRIFRRLRLLGHVEYSPDGNRWSIAPPVLVRQEDLAPPGAYFLCGQRDVRLLQVLRRLAVLSEVLQPNGEAPAAARVQTDDPAGLLAHLSQGGVQDTLHEGGEVAYQLAQCLPTLTAWMDRLDVIPGILPHMSTLKRFTGGDFVNAIFAGQSGFYQFWSLDTPPTGDVGPKWQLFYDAEQNRWLRGDWYGLRFLALQAEGTSCPVWYDSTSYQFAVPYDWRWPELYERVLVLASGRLPQRSGPWLVYEALPPHILDVLQTKLYFQYEGRLADA